MVSLAKKPSTALSQEAEVGVKWKVKRGCRSSQASILGCLCGRVVVEDHVDDLAGWHVALDGVEEADELLMPVTLHAVPDHLAVEHVERGEQGGGAVALVVVGHGRQRPFLIGSPGWVRSSAWIWRLLVDREHDGVRRRVDVQPDDGAQLLGEARVVGELEGSHPVRLQPVRAPDALHRAGADADQPRPWPRRSNASSRPAGRRSWSASTTRAATSAPERRDARGAGLVAQQPFDPRRHEPLLPAPDRHLAHPACRMISAVPWPSAVNSTIRARHTCFLRAVPIRHDRFKTGTIGGTHIDDDPFAHAPSLLDRHAVSPPQIGLVCQILSTRVGNCSVYSFIVTETALN